MNAHDSLIFASLPREVVEALAAYEAASQSALKRSPNHWHEFRDPFELGDPIKQARQLGREAQEALND